MDRYRVGGEGSEVKVELKGGGGACSMQTGGKRDRIVKERLVSRKAGVGGGEKEAERQGEEGERRRQKGRGRRGREGGREVGGGGGEKEAGSEV